MIALVLAACVLAPKVALLPIERSDGIDEKTGEALSGMLASELRKHAALDLLTYREVAALLQHDATKELLACDRDSCFAELGAALGADQIINANLSKVGKSLLFGARRIDVKKFTVLADVSTRVKSGVIDDLLDEVPQLAKALAADRPPPAGPGAGGAVNPSASATSATSGTASSSATGATASASAPAASYPPPGDGALPQPWAEAPFELAPEVKKGLTLATDGRGRYVAYSFAESFGPLFVGDAQKLHKAIVIGGSREGDKRFDFTMWDPRLQRYAFFGGEGGALQTECDAKKTELRVMPAKEAGALLAKAQLLAPRWRRQGFALARDDDGNYFYVDKGRYEPDLEDYRLFVGARGAMKHVPLKDALVDGSGWIFITHAGKLVFDATGIAWTHGTARRDLTNLPIEDNARFVYTTLGVYKGEKLGTVCDP